jgi:hypothetical protein
MAYGILIPNAIAATNIDAWNRHAVSATAVENGCIVVLATKSTTAGESEVWTATEPATGALTGLWMVYDPEIILTASKYKGLDPDPRNYITTVGDVFSVYKPAVGDIITVSADCLLGSYSAGVTTHVNATDTTGGFFLYWGNSQTSSVLSYKLLGVTYMSIGTGAIDSQRITSYQLECVGI